MVTGIDWIYYGDHFAVYTSIESLHCTPETNIILCQLYLDFKRSKRLTTPNVDGGVQEMKLPYTASKDVKWC